MHIRIVIIGFFYFLLPFISLSQTVTLSMQNVTLEKVFRQIEKQTPYRFVYSKETLEEAKPVSLTINNAAVEQVLRLCFNNQPVTYSINDHVIMVKARPVRDEPRDIPSYHIVTGKVINEQGEALAGATVNIKESIQSTATDEQGMFRLQTTSLNGRLVISNVGYNTQESAFRVSASLQIKMTAAVNTLDETVVIAYGSTTRRFNTGSVSRVTDEEISKQPVSNALAALQGRVPGLVVTQKNGMPGSNFTVQLRGINSLKQGTQPLFIIDGMPLMINSGSL